MPFPFQKKEVSKPLSPAEERQKKLKAEEQKIEAEYRQKLFVVRHLRTIIVLTIFIVGGPIVFWGIYKNIDTIRNIFKKPEPPPEVQIEKPPADFKISAIETKLLFNATRGTYDLFARLENTNPEWGVNELEYLINLQSKNGEKVGEKKGKTYILPSSKRSLIEVNLTATSQVSSVELKLTPLMVQKLKKFPSMEFGLKDVGYLPADGKSKSKGVIINKTPYSFEQVEIDLVLFNAEQEIVGVNKTTVNTFLSGEERGFVVVGDEDYGPNTQIVAEPNVDLFKTANFMNVYKQSQELNY